MQSWQLLDCEMICVSSCRARRFAKCQRALAASINLRLAQGVVAHGSFAPPKRRASSQWCANHQPFVEDVLRSWLDVGDIWGPNHNSGCSRPDVWGLNHHYWFTPYVFLFFYSPCIIINSTMFRKGRKILLNHPASEVTIIAPAVVSAFSFGYLVRDAETGDEGPGASP